RRPGAKSAHFWSPNGKIAYGAPAVCMIFNANDNYCQLEKLPKIEIPKGNPLDPINTTLIDQLTQIEKIRTDNCASIGFTNVTTLRLWLWNTDPNLTQLQATLDPATQKHINTIRALSMGLGLV